jgi:ligand-binding sensor domain-containing protein/signal transduction histidine kinase
MNLLRYRSQAVVGSFFLAAGFLLLSACRSAQARSEPSIEFSRVPRAGDGSPDKLDKIEGRVTGAKSGRSVTSSTTGMPQCNAEPRSSLRSLNFFRDALRSRWITGVIAFSAGTFLIETAYAIDPSRAMSQYVRDRWGTEQGFPRGPVYTIAQTSDGYLWIGTGAGLFRFDGWEFRLVKDDSGAFTITSVLGLATDNDGCLWIRLQDLTLLRYRDGVFDNPSFGSGRSQYISAMGQANHGELLVAKMEEGAFTFRQEAFRKLASAGELPRSHVLSLAQTPTGEIWMGTRDAGVFRLGGGKTTPIRKGLPDLKVNCLLPDGDSVWVGTDNGIVRWNGTELTTAGLPASLNHVQALAMARDRDANIWVGTDSRGLMRLNAQSVAYLDEGATVSHEAVTAVFEDREGNLWIGSANRLERLRDSAFVTYSVPEGLPSDGSNPLLVDSEDRVWFPPVSGGLWWFNFNRDGERGRVSNDGIEQDVVYSIAGNKADLWVGRQRGGLTRLRSEQGLTTAKTYTQADGLAQNSVFSVYQTRDGTVWAGTLSGGVSKLSGGKFISYTSANGLVSNTVASILESSDGTMWFATPAGLSALSKDRWESYTGKDGLPSEDVNCLLEDSAGVLWTGTAAGIAFRLGSKFQAPAGAPASLREQILGLAEDGYGSLWVATSNHVLRVNRKRLWRGALAEGDVREYGLADGLRGVEGVKRHRSAVTDAAGRIWFSLNLGISEVDPARLKNNSAPAIVHVQTILADSSHIGVQGSVHIPGGRQRITIGYAGLSLSVPNRVRYRFQLEGYDHGWSEPTAEREAGYTNLPPGPYTFRVVASNPDGVWSGNEAAIGFQVDPLFWQTWWFRASAVIGCMFAGLALYRLRVHQVTRQLNLRFEERLAERTRIAQELYDTLLQGFLSASMHVHVAADRLPADSQAKPTLTRALQLMGQVIEEGRNAVQGLRSSHSASLDLEQAFSRIQQELAPQSSAHQPTDFRVVVDGQPRPLYPMLRDEVYRIGREALINAFRHSGATRVDVELKYLSSHLLLLVRDNGCGIDPKILGTGRDGHWGLSGMREKADRIGARFHVWSSAAAGTEIELSVPSAVAFQDHRHHALVWLGSLFQRRTRGQEPQTRDGVIK